MTFCRIIGVMAGLASIHAIAAQPVPRLVEFGSGGCAPCKAMAAVLDEVKKEAAGAISVEVVDMAKDRKAARELGIRILPTQVFFDAGGKELFRHEGFMPKKEIVAKWTALGVPIATTKQ